MVMMLDHPAVFRDTIALYQVEQTEDWRLFRGAETREIEVSEEDLTALAAEFSEGLRDQRLTGVCVGRVHRQAERVIIELAHEQYLEALRTFRGRQIQVDWRRSVRHARLVYRPSTGVLKVKVHGNDEQLIEVLRKAVARRLLGWEGFFDPDAIALNLDVLREMPGPFCSPDDELEWVQVIRLEFSRIGQDDGTARFDAETTEGLYGVIREFCASPDAMTIYHARLRFKFRGENNEGQRTVALTSPNTTNLGDDDYDRVIEQYLIRLGALNGTEAPDADFAPDRGARKASRAMGSVGGLFRNLY